MKVPLIQLIPWDPENPQHVGRLYDQRIACGWGWQGVHGEWRNLYQAGTKCIWWIVLNPENTCSDETTIGHHIAKYPGEAEPLRDTSLTLRGMPRQPHELSKQEFIPVGHVALDTCHPGAEKLGLDLPEKDAFWIKSLYVSYALQGKGYGGTAMDMVETAATQAPLNARHMLLDTVHVDDATRPDIAMAYYGGVQKDPPHNWYARRGYEELGVVPGFYQEPDRTGKIWTVRTVFMHRDLGKVDDELPN